MKNLFFYNTQWGKMSIADDEKSITNICIGNELNQNDFIINETELIKKAWLQINEYFEGKRKVFDIPLNPQGTEFQEKVWKCLCDIPYGETRSYKDIALACEKNKAFRAVGLANNRNPIFIVIPCHRVIGADGSLTGYGGGLELKAWLLNLEKNNL